MRNIGIIGAGSIGAGYYKIFGETYGYENLYLCNRSHEKMKNLEGNHKYLSTDLETFLKKVETVVIAVKPQDFEALSLEITKTNIESKTIVSAMAGISISKIQNSLKAQKVIRVMPTTAIAQGKGVSGWVASKEADKEAFEAYFSASGYLLELKNEKEIDAIITTSGSGVAYLLYFAELLVNEAVKIGLQQADANQAARKSLIGLGNMLESMPEKSFSQLRESITSKKGITEAALNKMQTLKLDQLVHEAVRAACQRSEELNV